MNSDLQPILRVNRSKAQAKESYDRMSRFYDYLEGGFEAKFRIKALELLNINRGEIVLEIGFGTGHSLQQMAEMVGENGKVHGVDISSGMLQVSQHRLEKAGLLSRVELISEDAMKMPYGNKTFDAVFMSFVLELFDSPEIPQILAEVHRVLKPEGRLGVVSMAKVEKPLLILKCYEWLHGKFPQFIDCRPIYVEQFIVQAGFLTQTVEHVNIFGLPAEIVISNKPKTSIVG